MRTVKENSFSLRPLCPVPDALAIFIDFANAVKGHAMNPALCIQKLEYSRVITGKTYLSKRNHNDLSRNPVKVAQLEIAAREFGVPANAVQQFVNGQFAHGHHCFPRYHTSDSRSCFSRYSCPSAPRTLK